jgi:hypothetical protein
MHTKCEELHGTRLKKEGYLANSFDSSIRIELDLGESLAVQVKRKRMRPEAYRLPVFFASARYHVGPHSDPGRVIHGDLDPVPSYRRLPGGIISHGITMALCTELESQ